MFSGGRLFRFMSARISGAHDIMDIDAISALKGLITA
jgi:hypothetical protein